MTRMGHDTPHGAVIHWSIGSLSVDASSSESEESDWAARQQGDPIPRQRHVLPDGRRRLAAGQHEVSESSSAESDTHVRVRRQPGLARYNREEISSVTSNSRRSGRPSDAPSDLSDSGTVGTEQVDFEPPADLWDDDSTVSERAAMFGTVRSRNTTYYQ